MQTIVSKKVTHYILKVQCKCKRRTSFLIATGNSRMSKKQLQLEIPSQEWNGWRVVKGDEKCPICIMEETKRK